MLEKANEYWKRLRRAEECQGLLKLQGSIGESQGWFVMPDVVEEVLEIWRWIVSIGECHGRLKRASEGW